jgi:hypothetical protein
VRLVLDGCYEDHVMVEGLTELVEERKRGHAAAALRARRAGRGPHLRLASVGTRAGRVGEDRFKGRYHPHLIWDAEGD